MLERIRKSRLSLKLFSAVLAVVAWLIITYTIDPTINYYVRNVPVTFTGENELSERGLVLTNKDEIDSVNVKIRGSRSSVIDALAAISARADISDITSEGSKNIGITVDLGVSGVTIVDRIGLTATMQIDQLVDKEVPVRIVQSGTEKNKQTIVASESEDAKIIFRGAKSELEKVRYALVSVDISSIENEVTRPLSYTLVDAEESRVVCNTLVEPVSEITVTSHVYQRKTVAISTVLAEKDRADWTLNVKSQSKDKVDVGIIDSEQEVNEIDAVFDPASYRAGQEEYTLYLKAPEGVYLPEGTQSITAKLAIARKVVKEVELGVEARSVQSGLSAALKADTVELVLRGDESKLNKDNIRAYVDAAGLAEGHYELEVHIDTAEDISLEETAYVGVTIE